VRDRDDLAREAVRGAVACRRRLGIPREASLCSFDVAEHFGLDVRFTDASTLEGMYARETQAILVAAQRPLGRQAFTCAHELGHWYFDHGTRLDDIGLDEAKYTPDEWIADVFAAYLLMPGTAVRAALERRRWDPEQLDAFQAWTLACQFGVGLETLLSHLCRSLRLITERHSKALLKVTPKQIRVSLLGESISASHVALVDAFWADTAIDVRVGDAVVAPPGSTVEGHSVRVVANADARAVAVAEHPGISRLLLPGRTAVFIRVSRASYVGRARWRHLEDPDAE
jgi:Zn-dependent peptidase ImmA (M78 family)